MNRLAIHSIEHKGDLEKECVWLEAKEDIERLDFYLLSDTTYTDDDHISNELRHVYWFRRKAIAKGDYIKLMTKAGKDSSATNNRGGTTHTVYWGLGRTIWNKEGDCAALFKLHGWKSKRA